MLTKPSTWTATFHSASPVTVPSVTEVEVDGESDCLILACRDGSGAVIPLSGLLHAVGVAEGTDNESAAG